MDYERLSAFRAVAREGGFSRAARAIHKTQPAVSQSVAALEAELGVRLFDRAAKGVRLTDEGRVLLEHVDESFGALERARARLAAISDVVEGRLEIACSDTTACWILPPVIAAFRAQHPGVELRIANRPSPDAAARVASHEAELAFVTLPVQGAGLESEALAVREDVAIVPPDHALAGRRRIALKALLDEPLLLLDRASQTRRFVDRRIRDAGRDPEDVVAMELASIEVIKRFVQLGLGVSIVPEVAVREEVAAGALAALPVFPRAQARRLGVVTRARRELSPAGERFVALAKECL